MPNPQNSQNSFNKQSSRKIALTSKRWKISLRGSDWKRGKRKRRKRRRKNREKRKEDRIRNSMRTQKMDKDSFFFLFLVDKNFPQMREPGRSGFDCRACLRELPSASHYSSADLETQPASSDFRWGPDLRVASGIWKPMNTVIASLSRHRGMLRTVSTWVSTIDQIVFSGSGKNIAIY